MPPDQRTLYVTVSDPARVVIMAYDLSRAGRTSGVRILRDFTAIVGSAAPGLPDGLAADAQGHRLVRAGGVHILTQDGCSLRRVDTGMAVANCKFGENGQPLFITSGPFLSNLRTPYTRPRGGRGGFRRPRSIRRHSAVSAMPVPGQESPPGRGARAPSLLMTSYRGSRSQFGGRLG